MATPANYVPTKCRGGTGRQIAASNALGVQGPSDTHNRLASGLFHVAESTLLQLRTESAWPVSSLLQPKPARGSVCVCDSYSKGCAARQHSTKHYVLIIILMWPVAGGRDARGHGGGSDCRLVCGRPCVICSCLCRRSNDVGDNWNATGPHLAGRHTLGTMMMVFWQWEKEGQKIRRPKRRRGKVMRRGIT